jgi:hypothetical protein
MGREPLFVSKDSVLMVLDLVSMHEAVKIVRSGSQFRFRNIALQGVPRIAKCMVTCICCVTNPVGHIS